MRAFTLLSSLLLLPASLVSGSAPADDAQPSESKTYKISIYTQPVTAHSKLSRHEKLAKIKYTYPSLNTTVLDYDIPSFLTPSGPDSPNPLADDDIVSLGYYSGRIGDQDAWHGIATAAGLFSADRQKTLKLHLDAQGKVWHVGFVSVPKTVETVNAKKGGKKAGEDNGEMQIDVLNIEFVPMNKGAPPHLNKPIVVNKEGKPEGQEEEQKTFLQKYWWALLIFLLIQVAMGGGGDK